MTSWGKRDLVDHYGLDAREGRGGALGARSSPSTRPPRPTTSPSCGPISRCRSRSCSTRPRPGRTRTISRLLEALALIRDRQGITIPLVCPGQRNQFYPRIAERARELGSRANDPVPRLRQPDRASWPLRAGSSPCLPEPLRGLGDAGDRGLLRRCAGRLLLGGRPARPGRGRRASVRPHVSRRRSPIGSTASGQMRRCESSSVSAGRRPSRAVQLRPRGAAASRALPAARWETPPRGGPYPPGEPAPGLKRRARPRRWNPRRTERAHSRLPSKPSRNFFSRLRRLVGNLLQFAQRDQLEELGDQTRRLGSASVESVDLRQRRAAGARGAALEDRGGAREPAAPARGAGAGRARGLGRAPRPGGIRSAPGLR